ncbi:hypothetical protein VIGAN_01150100 [Vigna angularis var. angularis]|uniref:GAG-pre-integrase domain-containing protein n=1 Tax=Vigna angularis var. angularis TaxID=157739 RepID=A0A0S3R065_PHAAN|nr:hypothetical protein VIGAN_01150100 [Vigna angularis var. angularis]
MATTSSEVGQVQSNNRKSFTSVKALPESPQLTSLPPSYTYTANSDDEIVTDPEDMLHRCSMLNDQSSKHMIDTGCESHDLYHLRPSPHVGVIMESPSFLHAQLGHPSLAKLQQLVPRLSKLSSLSCESC